MQLCHGQVIALYIFNLLILVVTLDAIWRRSILRTRLMLMVAAFLCSELKTHLSILELSQKSGAN